MLTASQAGEDDTNVSIAMGKKSVQSQFADGKESTPDNVD